MKKLSKQLFRKPSAIELGVQQHNSGDLTFSETRSVISDKLITSGQHRRRGHTPTPEVVVIAR